VAYVNPCENCKDFSMLTFASSVVEEALAQLTSGHDAAIAYADRAETSEPKRERLLGAVASTSAFMAECHIIGERANSMTCDPDAGMCGKLAFIIRGSQAAANSVIADFEGRRGDEPPQPPQVPQQPTK
jgi:hypothetical protein